MTTLVAPAELRFRAMGSDAHVLVNGPAGLLQVARDRVEKLERRWSRFRPDSEISRLNALAGSPMVVSAETLGLDPGGIGKGYAADLVVSELRAAGAAGVCVNLGGDLRAEGRAPGGGSWVVGIEHPLRPGRRHRPGRPRLAGRGAGQGRLPWRPGPGPGPAHRGRGRRPAGRRPRRAASQRRVRAVPGRRRGGGAPVSSQLFWFTARASGIVAWGLAAASVVWGLALSTRLLGRRPRPGWLLDLHRFLGGLALSFTGSMSCRCSPTATSTSAWSTCSCP